MGEQRSSTFRWLDELLQCPACASVVSRTDDHYRCEVCARRFPIRFGVPDFRLLPDPYISIDDEIAKIERFSAPGRSFAETVKAYYAITPESPPELHSHYVAAMDASITRGAGILAKLRARFPETGRQLAMDLGCGTGGMSIAASRVYEQVIGVDVALRWLVMAKVRSEESGVSLPFICANAESLPFRNEIFDAVVADAVLEHVQNSVRMRDEALRVLKPRGAYFFTTNNRFSVLPEPHVRILGFGLLPRQWMEPVARRLRHTPYRTRLHSRRELLRLFEGRGEVLLPSFRPGELGPRHERMRKLWDRLSVIRPVRAILTPFVPQYFIVGQKKERSNF
jgi:SAM-dependent methyltransferase